MPVFRVLICLLAGLFISCQTSPELASRSLASVDCNSFEWHIEKMSFYEDNPTYRNVAVTPGDWESTSAQAVGLNVETLQSGSKFLESKEQARSFLVIREGKLAWEDYFNGSQSSDSNNVHSVSKSILSMLYGIAIERGDINHLDQKISELLPSVTFTPENAQLTLRHLLTMSSGMDWTEDETEYEIEDEKNWVQAIVNLPLREAPGTKFNYNTGLTHLLSAILTEKTGVSTCEYAKKYLFEPLGVSISHWGRDPQGYYSGGYNLYMTPRDAAKFGQLFLNGGKWKGQSVVSSTWTKDSWKAHSKVDDYYHYGFLWWLSEVDSVDVHTMWGYGGQYVFVIPQYDLVVVLTSDTKKEHPAIDGDAFLRNFIISAIK